MNQHIALIAVIVTVACVDIVLSELPMSDPPHHVTTLPGANMTQQCTPQSTYEGFFEWRYYGSEIGQQIYSFPPLVFKTAHFPESRFQRVNTYGLSVQSLTWKDAGQYGCNFLTAGDDARSVVNVIIIEPPSVVMSSSEVSVGQSVTVNCSVVFGGPTNDTDHYAPGQFPQLDLTFNSQPINSVLNYRPGHPADTTANTGKQHLLTRTTQYIATASDSLKLFVCQVSTTTPHFTVAVNSSLNVLVAAHSINIQPLSSQYVVNDVITCSAEGYPAPELRWVPVSGSGGVSVVNGPTLNLTVNLLGPNVWNCSAANKLNKAAVLQQIAFTVLETAPPTSKPSTSNAMIGLGVGLAIGISLLLTGVIVVVAIVIKRRNHNRDEKRPPPGGTATDATQQSYIYQHLNPEADFSPASGTAPRTVSPSVDSAGKPVPKPRIASSSSTLEANTPSLDASIDKPRPTDRSRDTTSLNTSADKPRGNARKPRPTYKGSQESLDRSIDRPVAAQRPQTSLRGSTESLDKVVPQPTARPRGALTGSQESLDRLDTSVAPTHRHKTRPVAATRASNESLDRSLDSSGQPRPPHRPTARQRASHDTSLDSGVKVGDRSRDSMDQSLGSHGKPRPGVAPKPLKPNVLLADNSSNSTDV